MRKPCMGEHSLCQLALASKLGELQGGCFSQSVRLQGPLCPSGRGCLSAPCNCVPTVCHVPCADDCMAICSHAKPSGSKFRLCRCCLLEASAGYIHLARSIQQLPRGLWVQNFTQHMLRICTLGPLPTARSCRLCSCADVCWSTCS